MKKVLLILVLLGLVNMAYAADCGGAIQCNCGDNLVESQVMWYDITGCDGPGLWIGDDSITLDCGDHTIEGNYSNNAKGIFNINNDNITIKNCEVKGFDYGIYTGSSLNSNVHNNIARNNENGIWLQYLEDSFIHNNLVDSNDIYGMFISQSNDNDVYMNQISSNAYGIRVYQVNTSHFFDNDVIENIRGIQIDQGDYNLFYENTLADNVIFNALELEGVNTTSWNNSLTGNSWDDFESNEGYPNNYVIGGPGNGVDYLPIWTFPIPDPILSYVITTNESAPGMVTCPAGDGEEFQYLVVGVRDLNNDPISGIDGSEFEFVVNSSGSSYGDVTFTFNAVESETDVNGEIKFGLVGDTSLQGLGLVYVTVSGVFLDDYGVVHSKTYDLNVDGSVNIADLGMFATDYQTTNWRSDYNWDGFVNIADLGMFAAHYQHSVGKAITGKLPGKLLSKF